eukprot:NODE_4349_length_1903_cov_6.032095.p1 GENE.NODE_4349_length_1903_cov_6.032095~~NODE_4349_length_1903_cov_6.032095.p1  ORF type:complete len:371 (+),score=59.60 NODE_4349_length_1903_cov_6.032095:546-1658(+)
MDEVKAILRFLRVAVPQEELEEFARLHGDTRGRLRHKQFLEYAAARLPGQQRGKVSRAPLLGSDRLGALWGTTMDEAVRFWRGLAMLYRQTRLAARLTMGILNPLENSFLTLQARERRTVRRATMDLLRVVPFLTVAMVPGASVLVPLMFRYCPRLVPSTFKEEDHSSAKSGVMFQAVRRAVKGVRQRTARQRRTDRELKEFMTTVAQRSHGADVPIQVRLRPAVTVSITIGYDGTPATFRISEALESLTTKQLRTVWKTASMQPRVHKFHERPHFRLRRDLVKRLMWIDASDARLANLEDWSHISEERLESHCRRRGLPAGTVEEQLADLRAWVNCTTGCKGSRVVPPLLALMCQVPLHGLDISGKDKD